jgi:hypothetical protein
MAIACMFDTLLDCCTSGPSAMIAAVAVVALPETSHSSDAGNQMLWCQLCVVTFNIPA